MGVVRAERVEDQPVAVAAAATEMVRGAVAVKGAETVAVEEAEQREAAEAVAETEELATVAMETAEAAKALEAEAAAPVVVMAARATQLEETQERARVLAETGPAQASWPSGTARSRSPAQRTRPPSCRKRGSGAWCRHCQGRPSSPPS